MSPQEIIKLIQRLDDLAEKLELNPQESSDVADAVELLRTGLFHPINTAPQNGEKIYLISPWDQIVTAYWDVDEWRYGDKPGKTWPADYPVSWLPIEDENA